MISTVAFRAPAKINPVLEVLGPRPDGYHELVLLYQAVGLFDELAFSREGAGVSLEVLESPSPLAADDSNLVVRAARLFLRETPGAGGGVRIRLRKRIPLAAGLGGGSSDAAATLAGLDSLFGARSAPEKLMDLAAQLGSDVPFFLAGGTALGRGRGEKITRLEAAPEMHLVLVKPARGLSTPAVYRSGKAVFSHGERTDRFRALLREKKTEALAGALFNSLQPAAFFLMPETQAVLENLIRAGARGALVSGSGPTVFGVAEDEARARGIAGRLSGEGWTVMVARTIRTGVEPLDDFGENP